MLEARQSYLGDKWKCEAFANAILCAFQRPEEEKLTPRICESLFQIALVQASCTKPNLFIEDTWAYSQAKLLELQSLVRDSVRAAKSERFVIPLYRETENVGWLCFCQSL